MEKATDKTAAASEKLKALQNAMSKIEKDYGRGAIMKLGDDNIENIEVIPSGIIGLDYALGVGGYPRGRIIEIYGPESSGKTTLAILAIAQAQKQGGIAAIIDAEHAFDRFYAEKLGVDVNNLWISQPDNGEQAPAYPLIGNRHNRYRLCCGVDTKSRNRRSDGRKADGSAGAFDVAGSPQAYSHNLKDQHHMYLHQPAARQNRCDVGIAGNHYRRQCLEVLRFCAS